MKYPARYLPIALENKDKKKQTSKICKILKACLDIPPKELKYPLIVVGRNCWEQVGIG
jgi:hypothetical protein